MSEALGLIETIGYTTAVSAADAALKAANVTLVAVERVIGAGGSLGVTIHLSGDVAAVSSAVQAGTEAGGKIGRVLSSHVIPRAHQEVSSKILPQFQFLSAPSPAGESREAVIPEPGHSPDAADSISSADSSKKKTAPRRSQENKAPPEGGADQ